MKPIQITDPKKNEEDRDKELKKRMSRIKHKIIVMSGKGGVGKTSVSVNLSYTLALTGRDVGLVDIDLHGPNIAKMLGVDCRYCHVPHPTDAKKEIYPVMTARKEIANWMRGSLMMAIKPADGSELKCSSCHTSASGKPVAKILGTPRDEVYAHEWMSLVMTTKFVVAATGEKLKCKHCHVGNYKTPEWQAKVILTDHIPAH